MAEARIVDSASARTFSEAPTVRENKLLNPEAAESNPSVVLELIEMHKKLKRPSNSIWGVPADSKSLEEKQSDGSAFGPKSTGDVPVDEVHKRHKQHKQQQMPLQDANAGVQLGAKSVPEARSDESAFGSKSTGDVPVDEIFSKYTPRSSESVPGARTAPPPPKDDLMAQILLATTNVLANGLAVMLACMEVQSMIGNKMFNDLRAKTALARDAQKIANDLDQILSDIRNPDDKAKIPQHILDFFKKNGIDPFEGTGKPLPTPNDDCNKGTIALFKNTIDNFASRQNDTSQQTGIEMQQITTTFNFFTQAATSLVSLIGELLSKIFSRLAG